MDKIIVSNSIKCKKCGDKIFSTHVHDFKNCKCGEVFVDGGTSYLRRGAEDMDNIIERSITMDRKVVDDVVMAVTWALDNKKNARGIAYAVIRVLEEAGELKHE